MSEEKKIPLRSEVAIEDTWALEDLYQSDKDWNADKEVIHDMTTKLAAYEGTFAQGAEHLLSFLQEQDEITVLLDKWFNYAIRRADQDTKNTAYQELSDQAKSCYVALSAALSFAEPEILALPDTTLEDYYQQLPALNTYRRYLTDIRRKRAHVLSSAEEKLLAMAGDMANSPSTIFSLLHNADTTFAPVKDSEGNLHELTLGSFIPMMHSYDRLLREHAFANFYQSFAAIRNTSAALLAAQVKQQMFFATARHYDTTLQAALDQTNVDVHVYHQLIEAVHENMHYMYDYVRLRRKLLKVDTLHMYDLYAPMVENITVKVPFQTAKAEIREALSVLGDSYLAMLDEGFSNRWIDVYENVGKRSGAYSCGVRVHPYVLLNYKDTLDSEFTTAHEMGHALHSYLSNKHQPVIDSDYVIFVAEVASTCNEALLMQHLLKKTTDRRKRAYLINYFLEQFRTTLYRQTMFAEFELKVNELAAQGGSITAESASSIYHDLIDLYFGKDITHDEQIDLEWARIPHFYYNYYVYQYATGFSAAIALSQRILREGEPAVKDYLHFLSSGCSKDPVSLLKEAGVDMSTKKPVEEALTLFHDLIQEMENITL